MTYTAVEFTPWTVPVTKPYQNGEEVWFMDIEVSTEDVSNAYDFFATDERNLTEVVNDRLRERP